MTQDRPDIAEILRTVREFAQGVAARTCGRERYDALCAAFLLEVAGRELAAGDGPARHQVAQLRELLGAEPDPERPYAAFCRRARAGELDDRWPQAFAFALRQVIDKVRITNPDYLEPDHRAPDSACGGPGGPGSPLSDHFSQPEEQKS
ncbi:MAG: DUF6285 domain-containing protein [Pseudomonadota bacterium]